MGIATESHGWSRKEREEGDARVWDHERHELHKRALGLTRTRTQRSGTRTQRSGTRFGSAAGLPLKDTDDHGRWVCMGCARGWDHERHESHERYASSTINLKASPTWWILLKIPSVMNVKRFGILWETSRSRTFGKVHYIRHRPTGTEHFRYIRGDIG